MWRGLELDTWKKLPKAPLQLCSFRINNTPNAQRKSKPKYQNKI
jgi:hypothetical protein